MTTDPALPSTAQSDSTPRPLTTQHIGRLGELLVQYELLRYGIDSSPMTVVAGVDLVAYSGMSGRSVTIQVKTSLKPKPGGGKGAPGIDWWVSDDCPAELYAFADLSTRRVWLFTKEELKAAAQQHSGGRMHFYMYTETNGGSVAYSRHGDARFAEFLFENRVSALFF
jgi:hypothetical protein